MFDTLYKVVAIVLLFGLSMLIFFPNLIERLLPYGLVLVGLMAIVQFVAEKIRNRKNHKPEKETEIE